MTNNPNLPPHMPTAQESLDKVGDTLGARENNYNNPKDNFEDIAVVWTQLLITEGIVPRDGKRLSALSVARLMVGMKLVRDAYKVKLDNWIDTAGYGICGLRIAEFDELVKAAEERLKADTKQPEWRIIADGRIFPNINDGIVTKKLDTSLYEDAVLEFYRENKVDTSRPMTEKEKILLHNFLAKRGFFV